MKKFRLILFLLLAAAWGVEAATITVSNDPDNPGQYDDLQAAVDAASAGDTIIINKGYYRESINLMKKLVFIGPGIASVERLGSICSGCARLDRFTIRKEASGSSFIGVDAGFSIQNDVDDILIENCNIDRISLNNNNDNNQQNILVSNSLISSRIYLYRSGSEQNNFIFSNNIIQVADITGDNSLTDIEGRVIFKNNIFLQNGTELFDRIKGLVLENNIFYSAEPQGCNQCTFLHNLTFDNDNNNLIGEASENPNSVGEGNIIGQDPKFVNINQITFTNQNDYNLQSGSPAIGAGKDGTDIGIYGGSYPWNIEVATIVPVVTSLTIPVGVVQENGQLEFTFSAEKQ